MKTPILSTLVLLALPVFAHAHGGHAEAVGATHIAFHLAPAAALIVLTLGAVGLIKNRRRQPSKVAVQRDSD